VAGAESLGISSARPSPEGRGLANGSRILHGPANGGIRTTA
jgi:hypothetical protein